MRETSLPVRAVRLFRLGVHLLHGICVIAAWYPRCTSGARQQFIRWWSRRLLAILNIRLRSFDVPRRLQPGCMLVSNHVSWLDIFAINAIFPATFVAKSEISAWPVFGRLCKSIHTIFIRRRAFRGVLWANRDIAVALQEGGRPVAVFPEGTTTPGDGLLPFRAALLQPAVDFAVPVRPLALRYVNNRGKRSKEAAWYGGASLVESIVALLAQTEITVELRFLPQMDSAGKTRREIAAGAHAAISRSLVSGFPAMIAADYTENDSAATEAPMAAPASTSVG